MKHRGSKFKLSAVITKSGRVIATGVNRTGNFWQGADKGSKRLWDINKCAEKTAILKSLKMYDGIKHLAGSILYVSRFGHEGATRLAKPCKFCQELIKAVGIKKVVYTTEEGSETMLMK